MSSTPQFPTNSHEMVDHIPVIWFEPQTQRPKRQLIMYLPPFSSTKELMISPIQAISCLQANLMCMLNTFMIISIP